MNRQEQYNQNLSRIAGCDDQIESYEQGIEHWKFEREKYKHENAQLNAEATKELETL